MPTITMDQVRSVEWGKSYLWDISFFGKGTPPPPFDKWFPAIDVEEIIANIETYAISDSYMNSYEVPLGTTGRTLRITFQDNIEHVLLGWMEEWINSTILNERKYVTTLESACRNVTIRKTLGDRGEISNKASDRVTTRSYSIFPKDQIAFTGNSSSDAITYSVTFVIAGVSGEFP